MKAEEFFADGWVQLAPRLRATLARAGAPVADRDDLVQETAIRLLGMWDAVDWDRPIDPLARQIALNLWRDQWRKTGRRELVGEVAEQVAANDTERAALARVQVSEVSRALSSLPTTTAAVLRVAASETESGSVGVPASSALRMARSRARRALMACVQVASAVVVGAWAAGRSLTRAATPAAALGAIATIACLLTLAVPPGEAGLSAGDQPSAAAPGAALAVTVPSVASAQGAGLGQRPHSAAVRHKPAASPTPYYVIDAGSAGQVSAFLDVKAFGKGVQVRESRSGSPAPMCMYGGSPGSVVPEC
jgi:DNA-directed RNA polymerase specialized sigma24 family protein